MLTPDPLRPRRNRPPWTALRVGRATPILQPCTLAGVPPTILRGAADVGVSGRTACARNDPWWVGRRRRAGPRLVAAAGRAGVLWPAWLGAAAGRAWAARRGWIGGGGVPRPGGRAG